MRFLLLLTICAALIPHGAGAADAEYVVREISRDGRNLRINEPCTVVFVKGKRSFLWQNGQRTKIRVPDADETYAADLNDSGAVIGTVVRENEWGSMSSTCSSGRAAWHGSCRITTQCRSVRTSASTMPASLQ